MKKKSNNKNMNFNSYIQPLLYKIKDCKLFTFPYPYAEKEDLLPEEIIDKIEKNFPELSNFDRNSDTTNVIINKKANEEHPYDFRYTLTLTDKKDLNKISIDKRTFWENLTKFLCSPEIVKELLTLYLPFVKKRFGEDLQSTKFSPHISLLYDKAKYSLGPHTDLVEKVVTIIIYLSNENLNDSNSKFGTSVYLPKDPTFICEKGLHYNHDDFYRHHTCRFKINNSFSFFRTNNSFHGVEPIPDVPQERKLIQYSIFEI